MKNKNIYADRLLTLALDLAFLSLLILPLLGTWGAQASSSGNGGVKAVRQDLQSYDLGNQRTDTLRALFARLKLGDPFSAEEAQVLTRFNDGEALTVLEADTIISRALYVVYVVKNESSLTQEQRDLLVAYQDFADARGMAVLDLKLQADHRGAPAGRGINNAPAVVPPNDMCAGAEVIPAAGPFPYLTTTVDITDATETGDPAFACQANSSRRVWYTLTPSSTALYTFTTCQNQAAGTTLPDTVVGVYTSSGGCGGTFTSIACNDDDSGCSGGTLRSTVTVLLNSGTQYFILVGKFSTTAPTPGAASIQLSVSQQPAPTNDTCATPIALTLDTPVASTLLSLANDYQLSGSACFTGIGHVSSTAAGRDAVFSFTAPSAGNYSFRAQNQAAGGNLVLYVASSCPAATPPTPVTVSTCLAAANRNTNTAAFTATEEVFCLALTSGQQVFVFVDETTAATAGGAFVIEVSQCVREVEPNDTPATANALACGIEGSISPANNVDFYSLGSPLATSRVFAAIFGLAANTTDTQLRVTTSTDTLEFDDDDGDTTVLGSLAPVIGGTPLTGVSSFLRVSPFSTTLQSEPYRLFSVVQPPIGSATSETEPNDTTATANSAANNYFSGALAAPSPSTDVDVYAFQAMAGDVIFLGLDGDPLRNNTPLNARLELLDSAGAVIRSANDANSTSNTTSGAGSLTSMTPNSPAEAIVFRAQTTGVYYARVLAGSTSTVTAAGDYLLSISKNCVTGGGGLPCVLTCPPNQEVDNDPGQCGAVVNYPAPTATGDCGTVTCTPASGSFFPVGTTTVTCSAAGVSCPFTVTVNDVDPPQITCPSKQIVDAAPGQCSAVVNFAPVVTDNCPNPTVVCSPASGSSFPVGNTVVTCTATDAGGNSTSCKFIVTVRDTQPPTITCPNNITAVTPTPSSGGAVVNYPAPVVSDNCPAPVTVSCNPPSGTTFPRGTTTVTCTARDAVGNVSTCTFRVTVYDICIEDDTNAANVVLANSFTGEYVFCCGATKVSGIGVVTKKNGGFITITHNTSTRKVLIRVIPPLNVNQPTTGMASLQMPVGTTLCNFSDSNIANNSCNCTAP